MPDLEIAPGVRVPADALEFRATRAGGPGGQHVNKVSSKVEVRVAIARIEGLTAQAQERLVALSGSRLTQDGELILTAAESRHQFMNRQLAEEKLVALVKRALVTPRARRATKPSRSSQTRRMDEKRLDGDKKRDRKFKPED